jgi:pimeloyl-ACP methyl ester carboxylesterase
MGLPPQLLIIHGLNNNLAFFEPLRDHFSRLGWETHFIVLPGHGDDRHEASNFDEAIEVFTRRMERYTHRPYSAIAFSQGGLFLQLWLDRGGRSPEHQVLLAPALYINRWKFISQLVNLLPKFVFVKGLSPKEYARWKTLSVWEYRILIEGIKTWQKNHTTFSVPTLLLIDPEDELVDARALQALDKLAHQEFYFEFWPRPYLGRKFGLGRHHIIMHPKYFTPPDWQRFTGRIQTFLESPALHASTVSQESAPPTSH